MQQFAATNSQNVLSDVYRTVMGSDVPEEHAWDYTASLVLGMHGMAPPFPTDPGVIADWELEQAERLLRTAEVVLISPAAHAAVMAAAATLEPADTATLDRDADVMMPTGLLVLPEPLILVNRTGTLSDVTAWGWEFITSHTTFPAEQFPAVRITTFMDRDGPVQPDTWREFVALARTSGSPLPRWVPDGQYGIRGDAKLADESVETLAELSEQMRQVQDAFRHAASWRAETPPEIGEWAGGQVDDRYDDFTNRYMFAFWRLASQGTTASLAAESAAPGSTRRGPAAEPDVRVIRLTAPAATSKLEGEQAAGTRVYHHRWPVRMHKVRQWYPSLQQHRVIWRGPYIKGPADAPFLVSEKAYRVGE